MDLVVLVSHSDLPFHRRATRFDATTLPVPADVFVYTQAEWDRMAQTQIASSTATLQNLLLPSRGARTERRGVFDCLWCPEGIGRVAGWREATGEFTAGCP